MQEETAKEIILKCVNALELLPETTPTIKALSDGRFYQCLLVYLKNEDISSSDTELMVKTLDSLVIGHFAGPNLVSFEKVMSGDEFEIVKLTLLLLYITMVSCPKLNNRLIQSLLSDTSTQLKLKYLLESIQKRGAGMSEKYLNILCQEKIDSRSTPRCQTPVNSAAPWTWGSPNVYSSSPKTVTSPLRELVQSPPFRLQKLLNAKTLEVKSLQQQIHAREAEKVEIEVKFESSQKKISKLTEMLNKCQENLKTERNLREEMDERISTGEDQIQQQMQRLNRDVSTLRKENATLQDTVTRIIDDNDELTTKNVSIHNRLRLLTDERNRLEEEMSIMNRAKLQNENLIDEQACQISEFKNQLEDLRQCFESNKTGNRTIEESFDYSSPMNFSELPSPASPQPGVSTVNTSGENMGDMVIDKMLVESKEQNVLLQNKLAEMTTHRDELQSKFDQLVGDHESTTKKLEEVQNSYTSLQDVHKQLDEENSQTLQDFETASMKIQELEFIKENLEASVLNHQERATELERSLASCNEQLKNTEDKLHYSEKEARESLSALQDLNATKLALQEEYSRTIERLNEDKQIQLSALKEEHKMKVDEINSNLNIILAECETLRSEKTSLEQEIQTKSIKLSSMEKEVNAAKEETANLTNAIESKTQEFFLLQQNIESQIKIFNEEKKKLMENLEEIMKNKEALQKDMEDNSIKFTSEKAALQKEIINKTNEIISLNEQQKNMSNTLTSLEEESRAQIKALDVEKQNLFTQNTCKEELISDLNKQLELKVSEFGSEQSKMSSVIDEYKKTEQSLSKQLQDLQEKYSLEKDQLQKELFMSNKSIASLSEDKISAAEAFAQEKSRFLEEKSRLQNDLESSLATVNTLELELNDSKECQKKLEQDFTSKIKAKDEEVLQIREEYNEIIVSSNEKVSKEKESVDLLHKEIEQVRENLQQEIKDNEQKYKSLQQELETTTVSMKKEHSKEIETIVNREKALIVTHNEMKEDLKTLKIENNTLQTELKLKEELLGAGKLKMNEKVEELLAEKGDLTRKIDSLNMEMKELKEAMNHSEKQHTLTVEEMQQQLQTITQEYENQQAISHKLEADVYTLKEEMASKESENKIVVDVLQNDLVTQREDLTACVVEKEQSIQELEKVSNDLMIKHQQLEDKLHEIKTSSSEELNSLKKELDRKQDHFDQTQSELLKEISDLQSNLQNREQESEQETIGKNKEIEDLCARLRAQGSEAEKTKSDQDLELSQLNRQIQAINNTLKEKEENYTKELAVLTEQVAILESEKKEAVQESNDNITALSACARKLENQKEALTTLEEQKKELNELLLQERQTANERTEAHDNVLANLKQEFESAVKNHNEEREQYLREVELKKDELKCMKTEMAESLKKFEENLLTVNTLLSEKEAIVLDKERTIEELKLISVQEKEALSKDIQAQDESLNSFKKETEEKLASLQQEKIREITEKDSIIAKLEREKQDAIESLRAEKINFDRIQEAKQQSQSHLEEKLQQINNSVQSEKDSLLQSLLKSQSELAALQTSHQISKETQEKQIQQLTDQQHALQEELKNEQQEHVKCREQMQQQLDQATKDLCQHKTSNEDLHTQIQSLREENAIKISEQEDLMTKIKTEGEQRKEDTDNQLAEKGNIIQNLQKQIDHISESNLCQVRQLEVTLCERNQIIESLNKEKLELEENEKLSQCKIQSLNEEISDIKTKLKELENKLNEKESIIMADKQEITKIHEEAQKSLQEQNALLQAEKDSCIEKLQNEISAITSVGDQLQAEQVEMKNLKERFVQIEKDIQIKENHLLNAVEELKEARGKNEKYVSQVRSLDAKLIDREQDLTLAKEEIMRVEREAERSSRSLKEELKSTTQRYQSERETIIEKMKSSYKTEMEKLMLQLQEYEQINKENKVYQHKYEVAKKKLSMSIVEIDEVKKTNEQFQSQIAKYKEHVNKVNENLKKEKTKNADLAELHQPLKEKLKEAEQKVKRLDAENRSLEAQVKLADTKMRDMNKKMNQDNFETSRSGRLTRAGTKTTTSDSHLKVRVSRPSSTSSNDSNFCRTDSSAMKRAVSSSETCFRKPERHSLAPDAFQRSTKLTNLAASISSRSKKAAEAAMEKSQTEKFGKSVPRDMLFSCEDEDEQFSTKYLLDIEIDRSNTGDVVQRKRLSELQRRNSLYPPHMRSAYPAEMQFASLEDFDDEKLRAGCAVEERHLLNLTESTGNLALDSPAFNLRKRKSLSSSTNSDISVDSFGGKKNRRLSTSYSRPGPPTPARRNANKYDKENDFDHNASQFSSISKESKLSLTSGGSGASPISTRSRRNLRESSSRLNSPNTSVLNTSKRSKRTTLSPGGVSFLSKKGINVTPRSKKGFTPSSIKKILRGKSPYRKMDANEETPKVLKSSTGSTSSSKLRIFRKPFGSRNYNLLSASLRSQESVLDLNSSLATSTGRSDINDLGERLRPRN